MNFQRGQDPKAAMGIGIKEEQGYNITGIVDEKGILPGINANGIYMITHIGSKSVSGFCSGKKLMKVLIYLMKDETINFQSKWFWNPQSITDKGGNLLFYYSSDGEFWVDANNTKGYSFFKMDKRNIMEL